MTLDTERTLTLSTKAQTLEQLSRLLDPTIATVADYVYFSVSEWEQRPEAIIDDIISKFRPRVLVVRSSTLVEDTAEQSCAGAFESVLNVACAAEELSFSIERVVASYTGLPGDEVLVQPMALDVAVSGVITTHVLSDGAPYYVLNYDDTTGRTDTVTGGSATGKTVLVQRDCDLCVIESPRLRRWIRLARHLEDLCPETPLEIEFAQSRSQELFVFQVRPIAVKRNWRWETSIRVQNAQERICAFFNILSRPRAGLAGRRTILGSMPDWNPAEIIGTNPRPLASSLYRKLITDATWRKARVSMGYRNPGKEDLMVILCGHPYIDVRKSFNSFLPSGLPDEICTRLVDAWIDRLDQNPDLHDKVEFEIAHTVLDFNFSKFQDRYPNLLTEAQHKEYLGRLRRLTNSCIDLSATGTMATANRDISRLEARQTTQRMPSHQDLLFTVKSLLDECMLLGTHAFAILARHAFIAETLLRSASERGAISKSRLFAFKGSFSTILGDLTHDHQRAINGELSSEDFMRKYGHLRPGTYDILSLRYDQRSELLSGKTGIEKHEAPQPFSLSPEETGNLQELLKEAGFDGLTPDALIQYSKIAIVNREKAKFVFTRHLSDALEHLVEWGHGTGLSREELSFLKIGDILGLLSESPLMPDDKHLRKLAATAKDEFDVCRGIRFHQVIRSERDLYVAPLHRSKANFITTKQVWGPVALLDARMGNVPDLDNSIVFIENADPGFDWIFTRNILGLVTKFGGTNSHMAVRCAELGLPAAIGCGERTFEQLKNYPKVELNCEAQNIRPLDSVVT